MHIFGESRDGYTGLAPVTAARESLGIALGAERRAGATLGNSAQPATIITTADDMDTDAKRAFYKDFKREFGPDSDNEAGVWIVGNADAGTKIQSLSMTNEDAQFLESRKFQVVEIARWFNIPPHLLKDLERATFSNVEEQQIDFVRYTIMPWIVVWEREIRRKLLPPEQQSSYYVKFSTNALMRGDAKSNNSFRP